ncbi:hypothetical protein H4Q26_012954 [Puccinia striiformis f. sp. tritici PST-130]|nr:hypothetical protein H4Q26_012954 [Puccinia striiformis f. sp. tritici PST-130]
MADKPNQAEQKTEPERVADSDAPNSVNRDRSIDVLRGLNCLAMVLVNTAGLFVSNWLSHASSVHQTITFADYLQDSIGAWDDWYLFDCCDLESYFSIKPPILPAILGLSWTRILGSLLAGLLPSPASKLLWTPTSAFEMLGQRSLEVYLISAGVALGLEGIGIWDVIYQLINNLLIPMGFHE